MQSSTRMFRGVPFALIAVVIGLSALVQVWSVSSANGANGYAYVVPSGPCTDEILANVATLQASLAPGEGATVTEGTPVTFTGSSGAPVTFAVASSDGRLLLGPDIDSGFGSAQPGLTGSYTFRSIKASAKPGTVYWDASFSDASFKECQGEPPGTETMSPRTLTVIAPPAPAVPSPATPAAPVLPVVQVSPVQASVGALDNFHLSHPTVLYRVRCTARCSGDTSYEVLVARRHEKAVHVVKLDLKADPVSITSETGGEQQITHDYAGRSLRTLESIIHSGDFVELRIRVKVTGASGTAAQALRTVRLKT